MRQLLLDAEHLVTYVREKLSGFALSLEDIFKMSSFTLRPLASLSRNSLSD